MLEQQATASDPKVSDNAGTAAWEGGNRVALVQVETVVVGARAWTLHARPCGPRSNGVGDGVTVGGAEPFKK